MTALTVFDPQQLPGLERLAKSMANSGMFGVKTPEAAIAVMMMAQADGLHPAKAMQEYHVIEGRPALKADALLARFQAAGGRVNFTTYTDIKVEATFSHPAGGSVTIDWTLERAKTAGLAGRQMWSKYPRQMLRSRVISEGVRTVFPGIAVGTYTVEEAEDMALDVRPAAEAAQVIDVTPRKMDEGWLADYIAAIQGAADLAELKRQFDAGTGLAKAATDMAALDQLIAAKDKRKAQLQRAADTVDAEVAQ